MYYFDDWLIGTSGSIPMRVDPGGRLLVTNSQEQTFLEQLQEFNKKLDEREK